MAELHYARDEPNAYAAGEVLLPAGNRANALLSSANRGLEGKDWRKLATAG